MPVLDGAIKTTAVPAGHVELCNQFGDHLAAEAVKLQAETGLAIADMVGVVATAGDECVSGVAPAAVALPALLETESPETIARIRAFLAREAPPTHLRAFLWHEGGVAMVRIDVLPTVRGGGS
jgi:hypothetical protein